MVNKFGKTISGSHPSLSGATTKVIDTNTITILHVGHKQTLPEFFELEQMGVQCIPKCGSCRCGNCAPSSGAMTLKVEVEFTMIHEKLSHNIEKKRCTFIYPWIKDPYFLSDNKNIVTVKLESTEKQISK